MKKLLKVILLITVVMVFIFYYLFFDMSRLPKGDFLLESRSPDGIYTLKFYCNNAHATVAPSILGEVYDNNYPFLKPRKFFWQYRKDQVTIDWVSGSVATINGHTLNVKWDKYDFRREDLR